MESISVSRSFIKHHIVYKDTYLKYIQFRTLHHRFFTNDKSFLIGIKPTNIYGMCNQPEDSIEHMFLECTHSIRLWSYVRDWIVELGMVDYNLSDMRKIVGYLENALAINCIILLTKKVIYNSMKKEKSPHFINVKYEVKNFFIKRNIDNILKGESINLINNTIYYVIITTMISYLMLYHTILCIITLLR